MKKLLVSFAQILFMSATAVFSQEPGQQPDPDFHLYLLIGQSNMAGRGTVDDESKQVDPRVLMLTKSLTWAPATDPLHFDKHIAGVGPGLAFGKRIAEATPQVRVGLIPCAVGGTSIKVWVPGAQDKVTKIHPYDGMLERVRAAQKEGVLKGIIWHQGESDLNTGDAYGKELAELITRLREDLKAPEVPFVASELPIFRPQAKVAREKFNLVVQGLGKTVSNYACASAEGLNDRGDHLHCDTQSARILGKRYAEKMLELEHPATK